MSTYNPSTFDYFNLSPQICFWQRADGTVISVNSSGEKHLGYSSAELIGSTLISILHPEDQEKTKVEWKFLESFGVNEAKELEYRLRTKKGRYIWLLASTLVFSREPSGKIDAMIVFAKDITEHKNALHLLEIERNKNILSSRVATLGEMVGSIAHEICNPLAVIMGRIYIAKEKVKKGSPPEELLSEFEKIEKTIQRISKIIQGLRSLSGGLHADADEEVLLKDLIEDSLDLCRSRFEDYDIQLRVQPPPESLQLFCRPVQIVQVLVNLLNNAHDAVFLCLEKWVDISWFETSSGVAIIIKDSGPGIPPQFRDKITMPFFSTKEVGQGCGLGLSISKKIMQEHEGVLSLVEEAQHTTFMIELPHRKVPKIAI